MKVITIQEPYATLIMHGKKKIETRSWKTSYRGKIYIHAGKSKDFLKNANTYTSNLISNISLNYGNIICLAELVDCIEITDIFIENLKKEDLNEYNLGIYKRRRYAWILKSIIILKEPISIKGKLSIWEYND